LILYGCETWSVTLREEHRLRVFENRALRRSFGPKRDEVTGGWRKLHNEELHDLYSSPSIIRYDQVKENEMGRMCSLGKTPVTIKLLISFCAFGGFRVW
jgi:hypothetical protein